MAVALASAQSTFAGGILTNTNQNVAFLRNPARDAVIAIDGVYTNPAGVAFLGEGSYLSLNWQIASQTRTVRNEYPLFTNNINDNTNTRSFKGSSFAPVLPSVQYALNKGKFSFQANFAVTGGGGKCEFDNGLGSFERIVSETAFAASTLARAVDGGLSQALGQPVSMFSSDDVFGSKGSYGFNSYMRGQQYFFGVTVGAAYKLTPNLSLYAGVRGNYAQAEYYGYVRNIAVGQMPLYQVLDPTRENSADIELSCEQTGKGFTPIVGVDYKIGRWNLAAKYEFKTRMRLHNKSVNRVPSIGNLDGNLSGAIVATLAAQGLSPEASAQVAQAALTTPQVTAVTTALKTAFDTEIEEAIGEYEDGRKIASDIPALLTVGVQYSPVDQLRLSVGGHYFYDLQASSYKHREDKLDRGTLEVNAGVEYDPAKFITVSAGYQNTSYGLTDEYMDDKSFVVSSSSMGVGACLHLSKKMDLNVAYFATFYKHKKTEVEAAGGTYKSDFTRTNNVWGVGLDIKL